MAPPLVISLSTE